MPACADAIATIVSDPAGIATDRPRRRIGGSRYHRRG